MAFGIGIPLGKHIILDIRSSRIALGIAQTGSDARGFLIGNVSQRREIQTAQIWYRYLGKLHRYVSATPIIRILVFLFIKFTTYRTVPVAIIVPCRTHLVVDRRIPGGIFRHHRKADIGFTRTEHRGSLGAIFTEYQHTFVPVSLMQLHILGTRSRCGRFISRLRRKLQLQLLGTSIDIIILKIRQNQAFPYPIPIGRVVGIREIHHICILRRIQLILTARLHEVETGGISCHQALTADRHAEISALALGFLLSQQGYLRQTDANRTGVIIRISHTSITQTQLRTILDNTKLERHLIQTNLIIYSTLGDGSRCICRNHTNGMLTHTQQNILELRAVSQCRSLSIIHIPIIKHTIQLDAAAIVLVNGL